MHGKTGQQFDGATGGGNPGLAGGRQHKPHVQFMRALVVVRHRRQAVHRRCHFVKACRWHCQCGQRAAARISTGMVFVNHPTMVKADLPFGGIRQSGHGRELLDLGLMEFVNHKLVVVADINAAF